MIPVISTVPSFGAALEYCAEYTEVFVMGGKRLVEEAFDSPSTVMLHVTRLHADYAWDVHVNKPPETSGSWHVLH
jgi:dihydrofolate reductase